MLEYLSISAFNSFWYFLNSLCTFSCSIFGSSFKSIITILFPKMRPFLTLVNCLSQVAICFEMFEISLHIGFILRLLFIKRLGHVFSLIQLHCLSFIDASLLQFLVSSCLHSFKPQESSLFFYFSSLNSSFFLQLNGFNFQQSFALHSIKLFLIRYIHPGPSCSSFFNKHSSLIPSECIQLRHI